tara:strand:- start:35263 stop:36012 length:750 start_codon:yes stop_codon:yes gene_type:complete
MKKRNTTNFGYKEVEIEEKAGLVRNVFDSVANKYDLMNDLMSLGIHRIWKKIAIELSDVRPGQKILDLASGTGDLVQKFARIIENDGLIIMSDINSKMLINGKNKIIDEGFIENIEYVQANAEQLPFEDNSFDLITIAFGLRNVTDKNKALEAMYKKIKPGGRLLILEFSKPKSKILKKIYDSYSFKILPNLGNFITNDKQSYQYLAESIRMHPDQETLKLMMEKSGFELCDIHNMSGGIVAIHRGFKL